MGKLGCKKCENYKRSGHNYCKKCGFEFRPNTAKNAKLAVADNVREDFCGYCGGKIDHCECKKKRTALP